MLACLGADLGHRLTRLTHLVVLSTFLCFYLSYSVSVFGLSKCITCCRLTGIKNSLGFGSTNKLITFFKQTLLKLLLYIFLH